MASAFVRTSSNSELGVEVGSWRRDHRQTSFLKRLFSNCFRQTAFLKHYGLMRTPNVSVAIAPGAKVPTEALVVPTAPALGAVTLPWLAAAGTVAW
jgi:hypothetical protein